MVVVCINSGPLMALAKLDLLPLVFSIYPSLTISEIVYHEVVTAGLDSVGSGSRNRRGLEFIHPRFLEGLEGRDGRRNIFP